MANNISALNNNKSPSAQVQLQASLKTSKWSLLKNQKQLVFMSVPLLIYILLFSYAPIWGWLMAFQNYKPAKSFFNQKWVGLQQFEYLFKDEAFIRDFVNTLCMSVINLVLSFVTAIILALLLNEIKNMFFKRTIQTISYLPHFLSWIIVCGIVSTCLSTEGGIVNEVLMALGIIDSPVLWLSEGKYFWGIVGAANVWKELGWNTIIYIAAIASIDPAQYEAAEMDGAGRFRKMWNVTLPGIKSTIIILLIMNIGRVMDAGFEIQYILGNGLVSDWSETIDIYVLKYGIKQFNYSLATAAGIIRSVISIVLLFAANFVAKKLGEERLI
ncbi:putative aldouronate transport system permease protein [Ruminiclostridium sufflavum DSM 19573]|uniref:Putative aldouronate transport system permease protein n=1 Tax=Ruminiclostridium sufflavum DSM 19573 TaxID=1121337 RepID=A0A318Y9X2_9FIRM|nr:ABC transporter permease subunit [Ruminiclostridium sufflavum]PYG89183.1 putative aldouronate transport system permease protein [Ruminiclostridium sufflavum DSM 19573]